VTPGRRAATAAAQRAQAQGQAPAATALTGAPSGCTHSLQLRKQTAGARRASADCAIKSYRACTVQAAARCTSQLTFEPRSCLPARASRCILPFSTCCQVHLTDICAVAPSSRPRQLSMQPGALQGRVFSSGAEAPASHILPTYHAPAVPSFPPPACTNHTSDVRTGVIKVIIITHVPSESIMHEATSLPRCRLGHHQIGVSYNKATCMCALDNCSGTSRCYEQPSCAAADCADVRVCSYKLQQLLLLLVVHALLSCASQPLMPAHLCTATSAARAAVHTCHTRQACPDAHSPDSGHYER
jgi:hypothetical protein